MPDERPRVLVIAVNNLRNDSRVYKEAASLAAAGFDAVRVGIVTQAEDPLEEATETGHLVRVVTSRRPYREAQARLRGVDPAPRPPLHSRLLAAVLRTGPIDDLRAFLGKVRQNVRIYRATAARRPDVVIACDLNALLAGWLLKRRGAGLVYDSHELWTETTNSRSRLLKWMYGRLERLLIVRADAVVTVSDGIAEELAKRYAVERPLVVMNGAFECFPADLSVSAPMRFFFQGRYAPNRHLEDLVEAMAAVAGRAVLDMQGFGPAEEMLRRRVEELGLEETVRFIEPCPPEDTVKAARGYDVGLMSFRPVTLNLRYGVAVKLFDYMGAGLAVATAANEGMRPIVETCGCGVTFDPFDPDDIASTLSRLADEPERVAEMKRNAAAACERYLWEVQATPLLDVVRRLVGQEVRARGNA